MHDRLAIIVCERTSRWADALRQAFVRRGLPAVPEIVETRTPDLLRERIVERRRQGRGPAIPLVEFAPADARRIVEFLTWHTAYGDDASAVAALHHDAGPFEAALREAGASLVVRSPRQVAVVVGLYERYLADLPQRLDFAENERPAAPSWRDSLPWNALRSS
jgi:hypothetical protein